MKKLYSGPVVKFVTALILLFSCSKVEQRSVSHEALPSYLQLPPSADVRLQPLIDSIWHYEHQRLIIKSIISKYGVVKWEKGMVGYRGKTLVAIIPLSLHNASVISGFIAFEMDERLRFQVYGASRLQRTNVRAVANVVNALNFKTFGVEFARIDDPCAMSRRERELFQQARSANPRRKIQLNVRTVEVTTCYSWVSCIGDGEGNCVSNITYHSDCISNSYWTPDWNYEGDWGASWDGVDASGDGGSGGGYSSEACGGEEVVDEGMEAFAVYEPEKPILDVNEYVKCFALSKPAKITFYADPPINGSAIKFSKYDKAGHAFITIEQNNNGNLVRRTLGFYPDEAIDPVFVTSGPSILGDNSDNVYDVKLSVDVTGLQLAKILNLVRNSNPIYDLQKYNCTNFVLDVSDAAGLNIKRTVAWWGIGSGLNPTNFCEDLKTIPGALVETGKSPANIGNCQ